MTRSRGHWEWSTPVSCLFVYSSLIPCLQELGAFEVLWLSTQCQSGFSSCCLDSMSKTQLSSERWPARSGASHHAGLFFFFLQALYVLAGTSARSSASSTSGSSNTGSLFHRTVSVIIRTPSSWWCRNIRLMAGRMEAECHTEIGVRLCRALQSQVLESCARWTWVGWRYCREDDNKGLVNSTSSLGKIRTF